MGPIVQVHRPRISPHARHIDHEPPPPRHASHGRRHRLPNSPPESPHSSKAPASSPCKSAPATDRLTPIPNPSSSPAPYSPSLSSPETWNSPPSEPARKKSVTESSASVTPSTNRRSHRSPRRPRLHRNRRRKPRNQFQARLPLRSDWRATHRPDRRRRRRGRHHRAPMAPWNSESSMTMARSIKPIISPPRCTPQAHAAHRRRRYA